jgi:hypothetical protein
VTTAKIVLTPTTELVSDLTSETHMPKPYDIVQGMERVIDMMEETLVREPSAQHGYRRSAGPSPSACNHLATSMLIRRSSPPRSNLGGGSHLATSSPSSMHAAIRSTYCAPTIRAHDIPSMVAGYVRRLIGSVPLVPHELPRL